MTEPVKCGGIVLCGGESTRMGQPKAWLPFGDERMLPRVVRVLSEVVSPIVVVAAVGQSLPPLPEGVRIARDEYDGLGPLAGLAVGLEALGSEVDAAYASACDVPLLKPAFVRAVIAELREHDLAIARDGEFYHPLAAAYRTRLAPAIRKLIAQKCLRLSLLVQQSDASKIDIETLRRADPDLASLRNMNTPEDYASALRDAGIEASRK